MSLEVINRLRLNHQALNRKYKTFLVVLLVLYFFLLITPLTLHIWFDVNLLAPLYVPLALGGALLALGAIIIVVFRLLHRFYERKLVAKFYQEAQALGFILERIKTHKTAYNYSDLFHEAGLYYDVEFTQVAGYELGHQQIYILFFKGEEHNRVVIHLPERKQQNYYQINNANYAPPQKFRDQELLKLHFVHRLALNYYASSNDTDVKIHLRKVLEKRFAKLYEAYAKQLVYIAFPDHEFLNIEQADALCEIKLQQPLTNEQLDARLKTLLTYQKLVHIMLEKREPWRKN